MTMSKGMNVAIDSCVFFRMIEFNNFINAYGEKYLDQLLTLKNQELKSLKDELLVTLTPEFFQKYSNLTFEEQIEKYKNYATNLESNCLKAMDYNMKMANNAQNESDKLFYIQKYQENYNALVGLTTYDSVAENLRKINDYKMQKETIEVGKIFQKALNGEYNLFVNFIAFDEILNHTNRRVNPHWLYYDLSEVQSLTDNLVCVISTDSEKIKNAIEQLALDYRTGNGLPNDKPMSEDINSVDDFGDSKIAAFSNLSGMILITLNGKDFIFDKGGKRGNDNIRRHLNYTNSKYDFTTDASVYSTTELLTGKIKEPQMESKILKYVNYSNDFGSLPCNNEETNEVQMY